MTESFRQSLLMSCAFASEYLDAADKELLGAPPERRRECATQLAAALETIEVMEETPQELRVEVIEL